MITIGCFVGDKKGLDFMNNVGQDYPMHLGFFQYGHFEKYKDKIGPKVKVVSGHLPCWFQGDFWDLQILINWFHGRIKDTEKRFILHPNRKIYKATSLLRVQNSNDLFCLENFPWKMRKRKLMVTPYQILLHNLGKNQSWTDPRWGLCLDMAHLDLEWYKPSIIYPLLDEAKVIHFSNKTRNPKKEHLPWDEGDAPLDMVLDYLKRKKLKPELVIEYMAEYKDLGYTTRDYEFLRKFLNWDT